MNNPAIFNRSRLLLGDSAMSRMGATRVILFGVGGVGSWCAESLIRSGIGHLTIVDNDLVSVTNINRQLMATTATVGEVKVEALRKILLEINPYADITARKEVFCAETAESFNLNDYDFIIDCIDSLSDKALLIEMATRSRGAFFSSMGAALKLDPTRVQVAEFRNVKGCPLARALRQRFKRQGRFPAKKFLCVFSDELLPNLGEPEPDDTAQLSGYGSTRKASINGSIHHITAMFGLTLAGLVIKRITEA
ncbi:MAG: tRNA threonylcarbamoyladenosine dehydratase [Muribaculaceae bacterium]|nr:tRNA threonylcarbamoyladenosine dehydratase [Muribaculaceae bacterium]MDE7110015.1 tRNA threonylcarbamoyladenosine dehydratase [Muribaculaceae bacterium]